MKIDDSLIEYLESLSRLSLSQAEKEQAKTDMTKILSYMERLNELDLHDTEYEAGSAFAFAEAGFREDVVIQSFDRSQLLSNAPVKNDEYFIAPKTVEI